MTGTRSSETVSTRLQRIGELARRRRGERLTTLAHYIDLEWMREAYRRTRKDGATGVDGQTAREYRVGLDSRLEDLINRAKSGTYRAPPVRRVYIPKGTRGERRPLGIPTFEDKVLQRAVTMMLEAVYEQDFVDESYGFRPGRSAHQAIGRLWKDLMDQGGGWVVEVDIREFFDTMDHHILREILGRRVHDGVITRLVGKWMKAGVLEEGSVKRTKAGTPQGGVISPLLANVYLHEVVDVWFEGVVKPRLKGRGKHLRYADDMVMIFEREDDARRVMKVLPKRFAKYGLKLHPDKTRLVRFQRPGAGGGGKRPDTFDFLGFTHYWGRTRRGGWVVKRKTAKDRLNRAMKSIAQWCRRHRHWKVREQWKMLVLKVRGHYMYYGVIGNFRAISNFRYRVKRVWRKWLSRRSQRGRVPWERFTMLEARYPLPPARLAYSSCS